MASRYHPDRKTGLVKQPLPKIIIGGSGFFLILITTATIEPTYSSYYLYLSSAIGALGFINLVWMNIRPNLYAKFLLYSCISFLCLILVIRAIDNLLPRSSPYLVILIVLTTVFAHTLPMWNPSAAKFIRDELSAPKTKLGKIIFRWSLGLLPIIGIFAGGISTILFKDGKSQGLSIVLIVFGLLSAVILPYAYRFPSSPWESS